MCGADSEFAQRLNQPQVIQRRGPQCIDNAADIKHRVLRLSLQVLQQRGGLDGVVLHVARNGVNRERLTGELWSQAVVQITPEATALILARGNHSAMGGLKPAGKQHGLYCWARLQGDAFEQPAVGMAQPFAACARRNHEITQDSRLKGERKALEFTRWAAPRGSYCTPALRLCIVGIKRNQFERRIGQFQRLRNGLRHGGEGNFGCGSAFQLPAHELQHLNMVVTRAKRQSINGDLQPPLD